MAIWPLEEIVSVEQDYAKNASYEFSQKALLPGRQYRIEAATIEPGRKECPLGTLEKSSPIKLDISTVPARLYAHGPLFPRVLSPEDIEEAKIRILHILQTRYLPYWSASVVVSLRDALIVSSGVYRIACTVQPPD
jgi:hypothetical protein